MNARRLIVSSAGAALAVALTACGGSGVDAPAGPPETSISPAPSSTNATPPDTAHAGAASVTPEVRAAVVAALKAYGVSVEDVGKVTMAYSADRQQITVAGTGMRTSAAGTETVRTVQRVTLEQGAGKWRVLNVVSEK